MSNDHADTNLEYLTIDAIQWATGHQRPRMALEEKRAKHRVHQQQFMLRQRQRVEQLQTEVRRYTLQLQLLEAAKEAAALMRENAVMQKTVSNFELPLITDNENKHEMLPVLCPESTPQETPRLMQEAHHDAVFMMEVLEMLPDVSFFRADSPVDVDAFSWYQCDDQVEPFVWPSSPSCATSVSDGVGYAYTF